MITGNFAGAFAGKKFEMTVGRVRTSSHAVAMLTADLQGKKYLLRIINTSVDTTYIFSIDNHNFTVMTTDFVPIHPYTVDHIAVGIGKLLGGIAQLELSIFQAKGIT